MLGWFTYTHRGEKFNFAAGSESSARRSKRKSVASRTELALWLRGYILFITLLCFIVQVTVRLNK